MIEISAVSQGVGLSSSNVQFVLKNIHTHNVLGLHLSKLRVANDIPGLVWLL